MKAKTSVRRARSESFDTFKKMRSYKNGRSYPGATPSVKAVKRIKDSVRFQLHRANVKPIEEVVERLNRTLRGWANYFRYGRLGITNKTYEIRARELIVPAAKDHLAPPLTEAKRLLTEARKQLESLLPSDDDRISELLARLWETLNYVAMEAELAQIEIARLAERVAKLEKPPQ